MTEQKLSTRQLINAFLASEGLKPADRIKQMPSLGGTRKQIAQGTKWAIHVHETLSKTLTVQVTGFKALSCEEATLGEVTLYLEYLKNRLGEKRFAELDPPAIDTPDEALFSDRGEVLAWINTTSIRSIGVTFKTLPVEPEDIDQHQSNGTSKARYYEQAFYVYGVGDAAYCKEARASSHIPTVYQGESTKYGQGCHANGLTFPMRTTVGTGEFSDT